VPANNVGSFAERWCVSQRPSQKRSGTGNVRRSQRVGEGVGRQPSAGHPVHVCCAYGVVTTRASSNRGNNAWNQLVGRRPERVNSVVHQQRHQATNWSATVCSKWCVAQVVVAARYGTVHSIQTVVGAISGQCSVVCSTTFAERLVVRCITQRRAGVHNVSRGNVVGDNGQPGRGGHIAGSTRNVQRRGGVCGGGTHKNLGSVGPRRGGVR